MSVYVGESRGELLFWLNGLLVPEPPLTKVEQCGTGAVYCQVMDSIYNNLPMSRVKFNTRAEYDYLDNFKVLQQCFKRKGIEKPIPVEKLVKCKMQDNLEFLQWMKKFWDSNHSGQAYDAVGRSNGQGVPPTASTRAAPRAAPAARGNTSASSSSARAVSNTSLVQLQQLNAQVEEMQEINETAEREKNFYFEKLRNIEMIVNARVAVEGISPEEKDTLARITEILYSTDDGFELPNDGAHAEGAEEAEEETF